MVHHVVIFEILKQGAAQVRAREGQDGQPGYDCFGGAGADDAVRVLLTWAPGSVPLRFPAGTALKISAGSLLAMQVHYNLLKSRGTADRTRAELEISRTPPPRLAQIWPIANPRDLPVCQLSTSSN